MKSSILFSLEEFEFEKNSNYFDLRVPIFVKFNFQLGEFIQTKDKFTIHHLYFKILTLQVKD
jgi:hypothetical protein